MNRRGFLVGAGAAIGGLALGRLPSLPPETISISPATGTALNPVYSGKIVLLHDYIEIDGVDLSDLSFDGDKETFAFGQDFAEAR